MTTAAGQEPAATSSTIEPSIAEYVESFEFVWVTIDERFYDSDFGGLDWEAVHDRYLPEIAAAQSDLTVLYLINTTVYADPAEVTYDGPVVVLVDVLSASSAEEFTGALQAMGRAFVIGEGTAGRVLVADLAELPNGALMIYPVAQSILADGTVLEGHGVIPDLPVAVHRSDLLAGIDPTLQAAIDHLQSSDT